MDFGEMKKNPAAVICEVQVSHTVFVLSNQNLALSQTISKLAKKSEKSFVRLREKAGLADLEGGDKMTATESPQIDQRLE